MELSKQSIQSRFITPFFKPKRLIDTPNNTIQGFISDLKCNGMKNIFQNDDHWIIFKDRNLWLFIDNTIEMGIDEAIVSLCSLDTQFFR